MSNIVGIPWHVEDQFYKVHVQMPTADTSGSVAGIYAASGARIPTIDWEAHGFDDFQLSLCVARALNDASIDCPCEESRS